MKKNLKYVFIILLISISIFVIGFIYGYNSRQLYVYQMSDRGSTIKYLMNNAFYLLSCQLGFFNFGLSTVILLLINGYNFGILVPYIINKYGMNTFLSTFWIYGSIELIGIFLASIVGMWGYVFIYKWFNKKLEKSDIKFIVSIVAISYICIFIAAILEGIALNKII